MNIFNDLQAQNIRNNCHPTGAADIANPRLYRDGLSLIARLVGIRRCAHLQFWREKTVLGAIVSADLALLGFRENPEI